MRHGALDIAGIRAGLACRRVGRKIELVDSVASSNDVAWQRVEAGCEDGLVILAEHQRSGRGRFGRVWESPRGALFRGPEADDAGSAGSDGNELELSIAGQTAARGTIYLPRARFALPDPPEVSGRGDVISLSADVRGLPPAPETTPSDGAIAEVVFLNLDPAVLVSLWSKSPGAHDLEDRLTVPIRPGLVSADGTFLVRATGRGRAKGPVRVDGALILSPDLSGALQPLVPVSQAIPLPLSPVVP